MERSYRSKINEILSDGRWHRQKDLAAQVRNITSSLSGFVSKLYEQGYYVERIPVAKEPGDGESVYWEVRVTMRGEGWDWRVKPADEDVADTLARRAEDKRLGRQPDKFMRRSTWRTAGAVVAATTAAAENIGMMVPLGVSAGAALACA